MLHLLLAPLLIAADPPVLVEVQPATPPWIEVNVPIGYAKLSPRDGKPAKWLLVDDQAASLQELNGAGQFYTQVAGKYRVVMVQDSGFTRVMVIAGKQDDKKPDVIPPPTPKPDPLPPPNPGDPFSVKVLATFNASKEADKEDTRQNLIALFRAAQKFATSKAVNTVADLVGRVAQGGDDFVGAGKLTDVRQIFADALAETFPEDTPLDQAGRDKAVALFKKFEASLAK